MKPKVRIRKALNDPQLLGASLAGASWASWRILLIAMMGEQLTGDEREIFTQLTGRTHEPLQRVDEFAAVVGRRGGKSRAMATLATYIAGLCDHETLVPGERGIVLSIAPNQKQATITLDYAEAAFRQSPILRQLIVNRNADALELSNSITLEVRPASFRSLRGPTYVAVLADEAAFWRVESSGSLNPDIEILNAVRPGLATTNGPLIIASSPYARRGILWDMYRKDYGPEGDPLLLVAHGASRTLNPSLPQRVVDRALEADHAYASAEYLAQFRTDIEGFTSIEVVESCVGDYREMMPMPNHWYAAFTDPSGGSANSFTLAISHKEKGRVIIDAIRERRPPFSPEDVVEEFAALIKSYRASSVTGDRYGGEFPRELFRKHGVSYELSEQNKSDLFRDLLPQLNSGSVLLPRHDRLLQQLCMLERTTSRVGKDTISHPPGGHDDIANSVAGAAAASAEYQYHPSRWN